MDKNENLDGFDPETELFFAPDGSIWDSESSYLSYLESTKVNTSTNELELDKAEPLDLEEETKHLL